MIAVQFIRTVFLELEFLRHLYVTTVLTMTRERETAHISVTFVKGQLNCHNANQDKSRSDIFNPLKDGELRL